MEGDAHAGVELPVPQIEPSSTGIRVELVIGTCFFYSILKV